MSKQKSNVGLVVLALFCAGLSFIYRMNAATIHDYLKAFGYDYTPEISEIKDRLSLTKKASLIFKASRPSLDSRDAFNEHCNSHDQEITVLGCYDGDQIYLYDIKSDDLSGVVESTAAHELLHAAWQRLGSGEQSKISDALIEVYNDQKYHDLLAEDLGIYENDEMIDELHSRIGTEIADLPDALEDHYAKYFEDQDAIVNYYENYIEPFQELSSEIDRLTEELDNLDQEIEEKSDHYYQLAENLSSDIDSFNLCANREGCFKSDTEFTSRRNALVARERELDNLYDEIENLIDQYNVIVEEYNSNILRSKNLENAMNSNAEINEL